ncbi:MAG: hypothetical protein WC788_05755 [Candidatus Paceibacterota bacterium]|jgi:hypothetical protein
MKKEKINRKDRPKPTKKQDQIIGPKKLCEIHGKTWNEHFSALNGNKKNVFYEIDAIKNKSTLDDPNYLLSMIEHYKNKAGKRSAIARMILNPGRWEEHFPNLEDICVKDGHKLVLYQEIDSKEDLNRAIKILGKEATNKISIMLC